MKQCTKCSIEKPLTDFFKNGPGVRPDCKTCTSKRNNTYKKVHKDKHLKQVKRWQKANPEKMKLYWIKQKYGLNSNTYMEMLNSQEHKCKICKEKVKLVVDHSHKNGNIRGLLCNSCNTAIGFFKESIESLESAILYLKSFE